MLLSFSLQIFAVAAGVIISIMTVDKLGAFSLPQPMPPMPRAPRPMMKLVPVTHVPANASSAMRMPARPFVAPRGPLPQLSMVIDAPEMQFAHNTVIGDPNGNVLGTVGSESGVANRVIPTHVAPPPPPPPPPRREPPKQNIRIGGDVLEAKIIKRVMPVYPPLAKQMRLSGTVRLEGVIARDGRVANLQVVSGHPMLAAAAVDAVRQWLYRPTLLNGDPVEVIAPIDVRFILSQ